MKSMFKYYYGFNVCTGSFASYTVDTINMLRASLNIIVFY